LASGGFANVYSTTRKSDGLKVAIKWIMTPWIGISDNEKNLLEREIKAT
jgi:hypothetical protein